MSPYLSNISTKPYLPSLALNADSIYQVPLNYKKEGLINSLKSLLNLKAKKKPTLSKWIILNNTIKNLKYNVTIGIVGKYVELEDSYYSVIESLNHAGWVNNTKVNLNI